jgi:aspartate aminotransferase-like enzyme
MTLPLELIPGPTRMVPNVLRALGEARGSPDVEESFWDDYLGLEARLQRLLGAADSSVAIQSGEAMLGLWGAMKSVLRPGDAVVCACNGIFGDGFAAMARALGADVHEVQGDWREAVDRDRLADEIRRVDPRLVTLVHCETPSGVLNALEGVGEAVAKHTTDGLLMVDFVSSAVGAPLQVDALGIDLGLLGPHKALSGPPALAITTVSDKAWRRVNSVQYVGYDALQPFHRVQFQTPRLLPYTHNWYAIRATMAACDNVEQQPGGLATSIDKHAEVAAFCRQQVRDELGLELFPRTDTVASPTVTAVSLPDGCDWAALQSELRRQQLHVGGSYGRLSGKVLRIGHMGSQADKALVAKAIGVLGRALKVLR